MLTQDRLKEILRYDPITGYFTCIKSRGVTSDGSKAGSINNGYVIITIDYKHYKAHRLAFLYMTGEWPMYEIDHINRNRSDNRFENLRDVRKGINSINTPVRSHSCVGHKNIKFDKRDYTYTVILTRDKQVTTHGRFKDLNLAIQKRDEICNLF